MSNFNGISQLLVLTDEVFQLADEHTWCMEKGLTLSGNAGLLCGNKKSRNGVELISLIVAKRLIILVDAVLGPRTVGG